MITPRIEVRQAARRGPRWPAARSAEIRPANARGYLIVTGSSSWPSMFPGTKVHREYCPAVHLSPPGAAGDDNGEPRIQPGENGQRPGRCGSVPAATTYASSIGRVRESPGCFARGDVGEIAIRGHNVMQATGTGPKMRARPERSSNVRSLLRTTRAREKSEVYGLLLDGTTDDHRTGYAYGKRTARR